MDSLKEFLRDHDLHINLELEDSLIKSFCSTSNEDRKKRVLSNWYEGYLYASTIGIILERRVKFEAKSNNKKAVWNTPNYLDQYAFLISILLQKRDILVEIGLLSPILPTDKNTRKELKSLLSDYSYSDRFDAQKFQKDILNKLKVICDEYMNGGLHYLNEKKEEGISFTDNITTLVDFLSGG